jgi:two-component system, cell cycle sensor histidine kinase and response regulator CckA
MAHTGNASVLVVDDQEGVRQLQRRALEHAGYEVTEASNGFEALELLEQGKLFDLVIADIVMPGLNGVEMACTIRTAFPDQKILYVTGQLDRLMDARSLWEGEAFLEKPFSVAALREAVSLLLYGSLRKPSAGQPTAMADRSEAPEPK